MSIIITQRQLHRLELEGEFQLLKASVIARKIAPVTTETAPTSLISKQLRALISAAKTHRLADIETRASAFLLVLEATRLRADIAQLKMEFAQAAAVSDALGVAKKIATEGAENLTFAGLENGLAGLFDALGSLQKGLDALSALGVSGEDFDKAREDLGKAVKTAADAAKAKEKEKEKEKKKEK